MGAGHCVHKRYLHLQGCSQSEVSLYVIQHKTLQHKTIQHKTIQHKTIQHKTIQPKTIQPKTIQPKTIQHKTIPLCIFSACGYCRWSVVLLDRSGHP